MARLGGLTRTYWKARVPPVVGTVSVFVPQEPVVVKVSVVRASFR